MRQRTCDTPWPRQYRSLSGLFLRGAHGLSRYSGGSSKALVLAASVNTTPHFLHSNVRRSGSPTLGIKRANRMGLPQLGHSAGRSLLVGSRRTNEPMKVALGHAAAGNRRLAFQNLVKLGCLEPTVSHRQPTLLFVLVSSGLGLALTLCR